MTRSPSARPCAAASAAVSRDARATAARTLCLIESAGWPEAHPRLAGRGSIAFAALGLLVIALAGVADAGTGFAYSFSILGMAPALVATYFASRRVLALLAFAGTATMMFDELAAVLSGPDVRVHAFDSAAKVLLYAFAALTLYVLRRALDRERALARLDPLTRLPNRAAFYEAAAAELARSRRGGRPLTVAYLDCDRFKQINDQLGHDVGDRVLERIGAALETCLREEDLAARLGGDEFALLLPGLNFEAAHRALERVRACLLDEMRRFRWDVTFSLGAVSCGCCLPSVETLLRRADALMYRVKSDGRDAVAVERWPEACAVAQEDRRAG